MAEFKIRYVANNCTFDVTCEQGEVADVVELMVRVRERYLDIHSDQHKPLKRGPVYLDESYLLS